jgi:hypothetical protein
LIVLAGLGPSLDITSYIGSEADVARIIVLGVAVGVGVGALRSLSRLDRMLGAAVVPVGVLLVVRFASECLRKLGWI